MSDFDVIVDGTRCASASLAMLLAYEGYRVLGIDRAHFPSDTLSTRFLWPRTMHFLEAWGLLDRLAATGGPGTDTVTLYYGSEVLREQPDAVQGTSAIYCPRRTVLDALLLTAAREAGADIRERVTVRHLLWVQRSLACSRLRRAWCPWPLRKIPRVSRSRALYWRRCFRSWRRAARMRSCCSTKPTYAPPMATMCLYRAPRP